MLCTNLIIQYCSIYLWLLRCFINWLNILIFVISISLHTFWKHTEKRKTNKFRGFGNCATKYWFMFIDFVKVFRLGRAFCQFGNRGAKRGNSHRIAQSEFYISNQIKAGIIKSDENISQRFNFIKSFRIKVVYDAVVWLL